MPNRHALAPTAPPANDDYCDAVDETCGEHFFPIVVSLLSAAKV